MLSSRQVLFFKVQYFNSIYHWLDCCRQIFPTTLWAISLCRMSSPFTSGRYSWIIFLTISSAQLFYFVFFRVNNISVEFSLMSFFISFSVFVFYLFYNFIFMLLTVFLLLFNDCYYMFFECIPLWVYHNFLCIFGIILSFLFLLWVQSFVISFLSVFHVYFCF